MKRKVIKCFLPLLVLLSSCNASSISSSSSSEHNNNSSTPPAPFSIDSLVADFDFDQLNYLTFSFPKSFQDEVSHIEGNNIASGDYAIDGGIITIDRNYLAYLNPGSYTLNLVTAVGSVPFVINVLDKNNSARIINYSFETGDLFGWHTETIFKGEKGLQVFTNDTVVLKNDQALEANNDQYILGKPDNVNAAAWQEKMGVLRSSSFTLTGSGFITFLLGAGKNSDLTYISVRQVENDKELARYGNHLYDFSASEDTVLNSYKADLSAHLHKNLYLEIIDMGANKDNYINVDHIETYHEAIPNETYSDAIDIKTQMNIDYAPNQLYNGDFSLGLNGWTTSTALGWQDDLTIKNAFHVADNVLKSNAFGDNSRGLIRSAAFRIDGTGFLSLLVGAGQGVHFDKDTFVSIRLIESNHEIFRFANTKHDGNTMIKYFVDLSEYLGKTAYFEVIDNATSSWDTIFIADIQTYYPTLPVITYDLLAQNLKY